MWSHSPAEAQQLYDGLLVGNHVEAVELHIHNPQLVLLFKGGTLRADQHYLDGYKSVWIGHLCGGEVKGGRRGEVQRRGRAVRRASKRGEGGLKLLVIGSGTRLRRTRAGRRGRVRAEERARDRVDGDVSVRGH